MMNKISGIYLLINIVNKKVYVGSSLNVKKRINRHLNELRSNKHYNIHLQNAFNKYGEKSFKYEIIEKDVCKEKIILREQYYLDKYKSFNDKFGYNICEKAYSTLGYKHSDEIKNKMSVDRKFNSEKYGRYGEEHWNFGGKHSTSTKEKMSKNHANFKGEKSSLSKLKEKDVLKIRKLYSSGKYTYNVLGEIFSVNSRTIGKIVNRERWCHI